MGRPVQSNAEVVKTVPINTTINKKVLDNFKDYCREQRYPMNVVLETFMLQYTNGRFDIDECDVMKWKNNSEEMDVISTPLNKEIYVNFKQACKRDGYFLKHIIAAFMELYASRKLILEYTYVEDMDEDIN